jgi:hypothetical protein
MTNHRFFGKPKKPEDQLPMKKQDQNNHGVTKMLLGTEAGRETRSRRFQGFVECRHEKGRKQAKNSLVQEVDIHDGSREVLKWQNSEMRLYSKENTQTDG